MSPSASDSDKKGSAVTQADQAKINRFASLNSKLMDLNADLEDNKRELENLKEANEAVEELEITSDNAETVGYKIGDVFFNLPFEDAKTRLEDDKSQLNVSNDKATSERTTIVGEMDSLKAELYSKFGNQINLDPEVD